MWIHLCFIQLKETRIGKEHGERKKTLDFRLEADYELNDEDYKEIENEIIANRADDLTSTAANINTASNVESIANGKDKQICLNDQSDSIASSACKNASR